MQLGRTMLLALTILLLNLDAFTAVEARSRPMTDSQSQTDLAPYRVYLGDREIPATIGTHIDRTYYARFEHGGSTTVRVEIDGSKTVYVKPDRYQDDLSVEPNGISLQISDHTPRLIQFEGHPPLFLFPESPAVAPELPDSTVSISAPAEPHDTSAVAHTLAIQNAIDNLSGSGGGWVCLEPGIHPIRNLVLRSGVTLYLAEDAVLLGTGIPADYESNHGRRTLILIEKAKGAAIKGRGIIDGRGHVLQKEHQTKAHLIDAIESSDLVIEDVMLRDPGAWTLHLIGCENVTVRGIKILGDWGLSNTDGIDPDMSRNVTIEDCFIYAGDDAIVVKTTGSCDVTGPSESIVARDCLVMTRKTSLKIGTESRYDIRDVLFENIEIIDSARACALWMRDGATYANITFRNISANLHRLPDERWSGEAYRVAIQERAGRGKMENILFENVRIRSPHRSIVFSRLDYPVSGITFSQCVWVGDSLDDIPHIEVNNAQNISMHGCVVELDGQIQPFPSSLVRGTSPEAVTVD